MVPGEKGFTLLPEREETDTADPRIAAGRLPAVPVSSLAIFFSREHKQMPGGDHMRMHQRGRKALRCTVPAFSQHSADLSRTEALS